MLIIAPPSAIGARTSWVASMIVRRFRSRVCSQSAACEPLRDPGAYPVRTSCDHSGHSVKVHARILRLSSDNAAVQAFRMRAFCCSNFRLCHARRGGLVLLNPALLLPTLNPAVHGAGDRNLGGGLQ
jgi:hypothetical protein